MIELSQDALSFSFPEVHPKARFRVEFQRTLRIPHDERDYPLPPGLGLFPLRHVDDFAGRVPGRWLEHGGVMFPMYQAEAMWLRFEGERLPDRGAAYPFAIRVGTGKVDAVTGKPWLAGLACSPQNYLVHPRQPWLDGYCVQRGIIRQFVAMPLGQGYSAEEQLTGEAKHGGVQLQVFPMKGAAFERRFPARPVPVPAFHRTFDTGEMLALGSPQFAGAMMGLAPGGRMRQEIYEDPFQLEDWDLARTSRCFIHLVNSAGWREVTGEDPPTRPPTAADYSRAGLPWFDYYDEGSKPLAGSRLLGGLKSVLRLGEEKGEQPLPENDGSFRARVVELRRGLREGQVREGAF